MEKYKIGDTVEITGNGDGSAGVVVHGFKLGDKCKIEGLCGWGEGDCLLLEHDDLRQAVQRDHVKPYIPRIPWYARLYRGIMGALFGPESHAVNRYEP
jgi:hypothetical protein